MLGEALTGGCEESRCLMTLGEKLRRAREARGLTLEQAAVPLHVTRQALSAWENDKNRPLHKRLEEIARIYQVDINWLLTDVDDAEQAPRVYEPALKQRPVPVISYVQAGDWTNIIADQFDARGIDVIMTELPVSASAFALQVEGLSMVPDIMPGDKVIVDPHVEPKPGDFVVAQIDDNEKATLKRYRDRGRDARGPVIELAPSNPDYPTLRIDADSPGVIVGTVVERRSYPGARGGGE